VKKLISFPDHHRFTEADIASVIDSFHACSADFILTTEKDGVRLTAYKERFSSLPVSVLVMDVEVHQHEAWTQFLLNGISQ
jgi:tetraacyldisaccharide-1-P 4'-kinase